MGFSTGNITRTRSLSLQFLLVLLLICSSFLPAYAAAVRTILDVLAPLAPNDDGSAGPIPLGFDINFFGRTGNGAFVNNNGNITFDGPLDTFTPFGLSNTNTPIVAPFFADVDTRGRGSGTVLFGQTTVENRQAFVVNWPNVGHYDQRTDKLNAFQLLLVDRTDTGMGNFDIEFNYDSIQWETGDASDGMDGLGGSSARSGYSNGTSTPGTFFEIPGSAMNGAFLDGGPNALIDGRFNSDVDGRYIFAVRNGMVIVPGSDQDNPLLPNNQEPGIFRFFNVPSGLWFDPPLVPGFLYDITSPGSLFTAILDCPTGFSSPFEIYVGGNPVGMCSPGNGFTFAGSGVDAFEIRGINPLVDAANPLAFPLQLAFSTSTASFDMIAQQPVGQIPEPSTWLLMLSGLAGIIGMRYRRRRL